MKLRNLYAENTPRNIMWRAFIAVAVGLLAGSLLATFAGVDFIMLAIIAVGVPLTLMFINLSGRWNAVDAQRKVREASTPALQVPPSAQMTPPTYLSK